MHAFITPSSLQLRHPCLGRSIMGSLVQSTKVIRRTHTSHQHHDGRFFLISLRTRRVAFHFNDDLLGVTARRRKLIRRRALLFRKSPRVCRSLRCPSRRSGHPRLFLRSSSVMRPHVRQDVRDLIRHRSLLGTGRPARLDDALYRRRNVARVAELWPLPGQNLAHHSSLRRVSEGHASLINLPQSVPSA